jgi:hypothetical protein
VTTVDGPVDLKIPAGTQPGTTLLMAKRGVPRLGSPTQRGDHQVRRPAARADPPYPTRGTRLASGQQVWQQQEQRRLPLLVAEPPAGLPAPPVFQVHVRVTIPKKVSAEERKLLDDLKAASGKPRVGPFGF